MKPANDDLIWVEEIRDDDMSDKTLITGVYAEPDGTFSFSSALSPLETLRLFVKLANFIMEKDIG